MSQSASSAYEPTAAPTGDMTRLSGRVSIRKQRAMRLGRKIVRITVGDEKKVFTIHEDLLCSQSLYFRDRLQKVRKPIEGECSICREEMHTETEEITFCRTCGNNVHYDCMRTWEAHQMLQESDSEAEPTCPFCRSEWTSTDSRTLDCPNLDAASFAMYNEWLYSKNISIDDDNTKVGLVYIALTQAWQFGRIIKDKNFFQALLSVFIEVMQDSDRHPGPACMTLLYKVTSSQCKLRKLVLTASAADMTEDWLEHHWHLYPPEFHKDLAIAMIHNRGAKALSEVMGRLHTIIEAESEEL